jgi:putative endopeptidase
MTFYNTFGYYLQNTYENNHSILNKKYELLDIFNNIKSYCIDTFRQTNMFSKSTKDEALKKLNKLDIIIGKQDYQLDLSQLPTLNDNFYLNLMEIMSYYNKISCSLIGEKINRKWLSINNDVFSFMVNAYYDPHNNIIYIPTGIMNDLFYRSSIDYNSTKYINQLTDNNKTNNEHIKNNMIYNYGGLGSIIGHEIMHSFDNNGAKFNSDGFLYNWWSSKDYLTYNNEIDKVIKHYNSLKVNGISINGEASIGENIADITGLKLSLRSYIRKYIGTNIFDTDTKNKLKQFFARWAEVFRSVMKQDYLDYIIKVDVHAPSIVRINAPLSHIKEYYTIFDVKPEHQNYLDPEKRCTFMDEN